MTSLGKLGGIDSTLVINHPEVAVVGINRIVARPVVRDGSVQVRQMMNLSSSLDHRVVDGALAAAYIQQIRMLLEAPGMLFVDWRHARGAADCLPPFEPGHRLTALAGVSRSTLLAPQVDGALDSAPSSAQGGDEGWSPSNCSVRAIPLVVRALAARC